MGKNSLRNLLDATVSTAMTYAQSRSEGSFRRGGEPLIGAKSALMRGRIETRNQRSEIRGEPRREGKGTGKMVEGKGGREGNGRIMAWQNHGQAPGNGGGCRGKHFDRSL